jgi:predicted DNA-binding transcriptional regulator AlpA
MSAEPPKLRPPLMVRERDLPALLGLSRATIRRLMDRGSFPKCFKIGKCCCWKMADIAAWIDAGCGAVEGGGSAR